MGHRCACRLGVTLLILGVLFNAPAYASPITVSFSGTVDLSSAGGSPVNTFSGFVTWESTAIPFETEAGLATYDVVAYNLVFNGVNETLPILGDRTGNGIGVANDSDVFDLGFNYDALGFFAEIIGPFTLGGVTDDLIFIAAMVGPTNMFTSTALPGDLTFLGQLTQTASVFLIGPDDEEIEVGVGSLTVSPGAAAPIPEPATLTLTTLGLAGLIARRRACRRDGVRIPR